MTVVPAHMSVSGTVHDGVLAESRLRDSALHELYGCVYAVHFTTRVNLQILYT